MTTHPDAWYEETSLSEAWRYRVIQTIAFPNVGRQIEIYRPYNIHALDGPRIADLTPEYGVRIHPGYCFDGATLAPDCRDLFPAIVLHDLLCQCSRQYPRDWPISRFQADRAFLREGIMHAPLRARFYYAGIRIGGAIHRAMGNPDQTLIIRKV